METPHRTLLVRFESPETRTAIAEYTPGERTLVVNAYRLTQSDVRILRHALDEFEAQAPTPEVTAS